MAVLDAILTGHEVEGCVAEGQLFGAYTAAKVQLACSCRQRLPPRWRMLRDVDAGHRAIQVGAQPQQQARDGTVPGGDVQDPRACGGGRMHLLPEQGDRALVDIAETSRTTVRRAGGPMS